MNLQDLAQPGVLSDPGTFAHYLTYVMREEALDTIDGLRDQLAAILGIEKAIRQKDLSARLTVSIGVSASAWDIVFPDILRPDELHPFQAMADGPREFPATPGDIFLMIKSERMDLNFQAARYINGILAPVSELTEDIQGFRYLDNRDLINFVDGTENPQGIDRSIAVLVNDDADIHRGGSYLTVQRYIDHLDLWEKEAQEYQEQVIGRSRMDNVEMPDSVKPPWAHTAKSKVEDEGEELKMFRQNRPWGNVTEHGTMFIGFAASPAVIEASLDQMITTSEDGTYDRLLDFASAQTGCNFFMPSKTLLDEL
ncbi:MAG: Dyp-type peroxidase [Desulforhopalus sp.]|nr:Dyp-type peroxidase [Desulforhopalus sp.]